MTIESKLTLPVSEQFLSIQGEGRTMGKPAYFLRLKSCNLLCGGKGTDKDGKLHNGATWRCDTIEVWLKGISKSFDEIVEGFGGLEFIENVANQTHHLIITGGEPLLHRETLKHFINYLYRRCGARHGSPKVEVETNGTIRAEGLLGMVDYWNVSPKLANSGIPKDKRIMAHTLAEFSRNNDAIFKFVVSDALDYQEIHLLALSLGLSKQQIWLMPAADNRKDLVKVSQFVAQICFKHGFNYSSRLHVQIWDKKTGV